jgi:N-methylhydantoinase A
MPVLGCIRGLLTDRTDVGEAAMIVGVDTGGTFTDAVAVIAGKVRVLKLPSSASAPARAVLSALETLGLTPSAPAGSSVVHGTTVATNALLEGKGGPAALVVTEGYRDLLEIGRQNRRRIYDLLPAKATFPLPRDMIFTAKERALASGEIARAISPREVGRVTGHLGKAGARSVAVCFLHSYANPSNEDKVGAALRDAGFLVSLSHEVVGEFREFERCSTTFVNAYLAPVVRDYLESLVKGLHGIPFSVMQSAGGTSSAARSARLPVRTLLSGPAAGVIGAAVVAAAAGFKRILTLDMGGTSTDVSLVDGVPARAPSVEVGGLPVVTPSVMIETVGAGGGSLAYVDRGGALKVGPESAGADPGPACYGRAERPAVTDANLVLGRIPEEGLLDGEFPVHVDRARAAVGKLAHALGISLEQAGDGVIRVANVTMEKAIRVVSVEKGYDPRDFMLVAFGGAGGLHACELAEALGIPGVLVPPQPGLLSAYGLLCADAVEEKSRTVFLKPDDKRALSAALNTLCDEVREVLYEEEAPRGRVRLSKMADLRYVGQSYEISVPFGSALVERFHKAHRKLYGHAEPQAPVEVVNVRVRGTRRSSTPPPLDAAGAGRGRGRRKARIWWRGGWAEATAVDRSALAAGVRVRGPGIVCEYSATTFIPPGWTGTVGEGAVLSLRREG